MKQMTFPIVVALFSIAFMATNSAGGFAQAGIVSYNINNNNNVGTMADSVEKVGNRKQRHGRRSGRDYHGKYFHHGRYIGGRYYGGRGYKDRRAKTRGYYSGRSGLKRNRGVGFGRGRN